MKLLGQIWRMHGIISAGQLIPKQQPLGPLPKEEEVGLVFLYLPWCELEAASIVSNDNVLAGPNSCYLL